MAVAIVVWDGFRPDQMSWALTPNLMRLASGGTWLRESRCAYPPHTRVNCASLVTGSWPIRHGLAANTLYVPDLDAVVTLAERPSVQHLAAARGGELFGVPSLGRVLRDAGRTLCVVSAASRGSTTILGWGASAVLGDGFAEPVGLEPRVEAVCGPSRGRADPAALNAYATRVAVSYALPELRPDVLLLWLCEPDVAQHATGVGSPAALAAIAANDRLLGEIAGAVPDLLVISDHGHTDVRRSGPATVAAIEELTGLHGGTDFVLASDGVVVRRPAVADPIVSALRRLPTVGPVFTKEPHPRAMALSTVQLGGPWAPDIKYSHASHDGHVLAGAEQGYASTHGTLDPSDLNNLFVAAGPSFWPGEVSGIACGIVDVAPTVLHLLGLARPDAWQGRVVTEALAGGTSPVERPDMLRRAGQVLRLSTVEHTSYVMSGGVEP